MQGERATNHHEIAKRRSVPNDHGRLGHETRRDTCNGEIFFAEILLPEMSKHFTGNWSFQFNGRSLPAHINCAEMIFVFQSHLRKLLHCFPESYNEPPVWCKTKCMDIFVSAYCLSRFF